MLLYGSKYLENEQHRDQKKKECYFCTLKTKPLTFMPPSAALLIFLSVRSVPVRIFKILFTLDGFPSSKVL